jgi:hypothetical protein
MEQVEVADELLRDAIEVAFVVAVAASRARPAVPVPAALKPFLKLQKLPDRALAPIRRVIESDAGFRTLVLPAASEALVGRAGWLWLHRPEGWQAELLDLAAAEEADTGAEKVSSKRLAGAEAAARRATADLVAANAAAQQARVELERERSARREIELELERTRSRLAQSDIELGAARRRIQAAETESCQADEDRHAAIDRADTATARADVLQSELEMVRAELRLVRLTTAAAPASPVAAAGPTGPASNSPELAAVLTRAATATSDMSEALRELAGLMGEQEREETAVPKPVRTRQPRPVRTAIRLPGGVRTDSREAVEHLLRAEAVEVIVDGYNLAKRRWPGEELAEQRRRAVDLVAEVGARFGRTVLVVFDGADVTSPPVGRRGVRVQFSPAGTIADDVIVATVAAIALEIPVVVVTDDAELRTRVGVLGATAVRLEPFFESARRPA